MERKIRHSFKQFPKNEKAQLSINPRLLKAATKRQPLGWRLAERKINRLPQGRLVHEPFAYRPRLNTALCTLLVVNFEIGIKINVATQVENARCNIAFNLAPRAAPANQ